MGKYTCDTSFFVFVFIGGGEECRPRNNSFGLPAEELYPDFGAAGREVDNGAHPLGHTSFSSDWWGGCKVWKKDQWLRVLDTCVSVAALSPASCGTLGSHFSFLA